MLFVARAALNSPATFVEYAKMNRRIGKLEKELAVMQQSMQTSPVLGRVEKVCVFAVACRAVLIAVVSFRVQLMPFMRLPLILWFWSIPMMVFDSNVLWPASWWLSMGGWPSDTIGVLAWNEVCVATVKLLLDV